MATTTSSSLLHLLIDSETARHEGRLKEIRRAVKKLAMFQPTFARLQERKVHVDLHLVRINHNGNLTITKGGPCSWDNQLAQELLADGYREVERSTSHNYAHVVLKKGRLSVELMIDERAEAGGAA